MDCKFNNEKVFKPKNPKAKNKKKCLFDLSRPTGKNWADSEHLHLYVEPSTLTITQGTVSGSGTGPLDYGATGPVPDTEPRL